jgi:N-acetylglucosaminyldiphosphoundecaprenol N-acetyl-beta-D-mannosaminyltransferase
LPEAVDLLDQASELPNAHVVVTVNVDHVVQLDENLPLKQMYASADFIFADGMPIVWCSHLFRQDLPCRVTGADLFVKLCERAQASGKSIFVLGGMPGEEEMLQARYARIYPGLRVHLLCPSSNFDPQGVEAEEVAMLIRDLAPDFIFVCLGFPKQERWAFHHAAGLPSGVILCVGAAQEFALGLKKRAPEWMQQIGMEWLWRLLSHPKKLWRRYLVQGPTFLPIVFREWKKRNI